MSEANARIPELSVVLATYNRAETLRTTLEHLARQDLAASAFEVIVVDDGSEDHTGAVVEEARSQLPLRLSYLRHDNRGPGYTQNRGIREAKAPLLLLMADDIWLSEGALRAHLEAHQRGSEAGLAVLGRVIQSPELTQTVFLRNWDPFKFRELEGSKELPWWMFWGCNISIRRAFLERHGMFREHRGRGGAPAHEDVELGYRLRQHGLRIVLSEEAWGHHHHVYSLEQAIDRYYERGLNWEELRSFVPDAELLVVNHVLRPDTLGEYRRVLRGPNSLRGRERSFAWHVLRHLMIRAAFNRVSVPLVWARIFAAAERRPGLARHMNRHLYRAFLYYHFLRGVSDAASRFPLPEGSSTATR